MRRLDLSLGLIAAALTAAACGPAVSETDAAMTAETPPARTSNAQTAPALNERALGFWRLSPAGGGGDCLIALNRLAAEGGGFGVYVERCADKGLATAARWRPDGEQVVIEDASGQALMRLSPDGQAWTGVDASGGAWTMAPTPA